MAKSAIRSSGPPRAVDAGGAPRPEAQDFVPADVDGDDLDVIVGGGGVLLALPDLVQGVLELGGGKKGVGAGGAGHTEVEQLQAAIAVALAAAERIESQGHVAAGGGVRRADTEGQGVAESNVGGGLLGGGGSRRQEGQRQKRRQKRQQPSHGSDIEMLREVGQRVYRHTADPQLEVEVRAGAIAGAADGADLLALGHALALAHVRCGEVRVNSLCAVRMADDDVGAGAPVDAGNQDDGARGGSDDGGAVATDGVDVNRVVVGVATPALPEVGGDVA